MGHPVRWGGGVPLLPEVCDGAGAGGQQVKHEFNTQWMLGLMR